MKTILSIVIISIFMTSIALSETLKGKVIGIIGESEEVLIGANVVWEGTKSGTKTDKNGEFTIERHPTAHMIKVSYTGYEPTTVHVEHDNSEIIIKLKANARTEEIKVEASAPSRTIDKSEIVSSETITAAGLRKAACCNLSESFETNPTVDVNYTDAVTGMKQIQLLGLAGIYSAMLYEKIPLNRGLANNIGLSHVPGPWINAIQISKGAASVQNGYESITGEINIDYKQPNDSEKLFINTYVNNMQRLEFNGNSRYKINDNLSTMMLVHASQNQMDVDENGDGFFDTPMNRFFNIMNRWEYVNGGYEAKFGVKALTEERLSGQVGSHRSDNTPNDNLYGIGINTDRFEVFAKNGYVFPTKRYVSMGLITNYAHTDMNTYFGNRNYDGRQNSLYSNLIFSTESYATEEGDINHKYIFGASMRLDNFNERAFDTTITRQEEVPGVFVEYVYSGIKGLTLQPGVRADFHNLFGTFFSPRVHAKYELGDHSAIRLSAGKGFRINNIYAENFQYIASSRTFEVAGTLRPEEAWNYGLNFNSEFFLFNQLFQFNADFFHTDFVNQVVVDVDATPNQVNFYNLDGRSYSNSMQFDISFEPIYRLEFLFAYRFIDVMQTINGQLRERPLISRHKSLANVMYTTEDDKWSFDLTGIVNGGGRMPDTFDSPAEFQLASRFNPFFLMMGQITRKFGDLEVYLGSENLTNFTQPNPIVSADNPFGDFFDSSFVYGPIAPRMIYAGMRWELK